MNAPARFALALLCWAAAAAVGWWLQRPPPLVTASAPPAAASAADGDAVLPTRPQALAQRIAQADPMGLKRTPALQSGLPGAAGGPGAAPGADALSWRLAALVVREHERYAVLTAPEHKPLQIREGERLPDGDRVVRIDAHSIQVRGPRGRPRTLTLTEP